MVVQVEQPLEYLRDPTAGGKRVVCRGRGAVQPRPGPAIGETERGRAGGNWSLIDGTQSGSWLTWRK